MAEVPRIRTPQPREALEQGLALQRGLTRRQRCFLLGQLLIENGNGESIHNHNLGNLIVPLSQQGGPIPFWRPPWFEVGPESSERHKELHELMLAGEEPSAFRAFGSFEEGLSFYVKRVRERFPSLLRASSPSAFVSAWRSSGYTPRLNVAATLRTFRELVQCPSGPSIGTIVLVGGAAAGVWYWLRKRGARAASL